jgi:hypothetical protein
MADHAARGLGIGYAHAAPLSSRRVILRWQRYWEPRCVVEAKRRDDATDSFYNLKLAYKRRIDTLLRAKIRWSVITANALDSPLALGTEFDRNLALAIERRRCRLGREKGKGKKYDRTGSGGK